MIACAALLLVSGYFFWYKPKYIAAKANVINLNKEIEVTVTNVAKQQVQLSTELSGRVNAHQISEIRPQISGVVRKIKFTQGSLVKKSQQLYEIDSDVYKAAYNSASRNLKALQAKKNRYKNLLAQDAISKQEFDDIKASFAAAQSEFSAAKKNLEYTKILAPISGHIGKSNITEGALVTANQTNILTTITQLDPVYVDFEQPSRDVISAGHHKKIPVTLFTDDPDYQNTGEVLFSEKFVDESTDSVRLRAIFQNKDQKLLPGMFVKGKIYLKPFKAITVPQRAASRAPNGALTVWVVDEGSFAKPRIIKADKIYQDSWIVKDGVNEGEIIVYEGFQKLADGAKVKPIPLVKE